VPVHAFTVFKFDTVVLVPTRVPTDTVLEITLVLDIFVINALVDVILVNVAFAIVLLFDTIKVPEHILTANIFPSVPELETIVPIDPDPDTIRFVNDVFVALKFTMVPFNEFKD
jgi:hypothetical protein